MKNEIDLLDIREEITIAIALLEKAAEYSQEISENSTLTELFDHLEVLLENINCMIH